MSLKLITGPTLEPITAGEAKAHLRVIGADDDTLIAGLIVAARHAAEHMTGRSLMLQTWELALDEFEDEIFLPHPPLTSITSIAYRDTAGTLQTLATDAYLIDDHSQPARVVPAYGTCWPSTRCQPNAVLLKYVAGYANAAAVPQEIKQWMLLRIGMLYENRESVASGVTLAEVPFVDRLLDAYRVWGA